MVERVKMKGAALGLCLCVGFSFGVVGQVSAQDNALQAFNARNNPSTASMAFNLGDYDLAKSMANRTDDAPALIVRAKLAAMKGELEEATRFARVAATKATLPADRREAEGLEGQFLIERGLWTEAEAALRESLKRDGVSLGARFELGNLLWMQGKTAEATQILDQFSSLYNNGAITSAADLTRLGRAMWRLGRFQDANLAFQQAVNADPNHLAAHIFWGQLLLEKYNLSDANDSFVAALKLNPNSPEALAGRALVLMLTSNQSEEVHAQLDHALKVAPGALAPKMVRAHLALRDEDLIAARENVEQLLALRPKDLDALTLKATVQYLANDQDTFKQTQSQLLSLSPKNADFFVAVADYGVRAHRYVEALSLYRDALKLNPEHSGALLGLGIGLSRTGEEDEAYALLQRAFDADPYNVRAYNMVELYEKTMPEYEFTLYDGFKVRAHKDQREMINLLVAPVVKDALAAFTTKYKTKPWSQIAVEIYPHPQTFSIRSVGVPNISPHGICFGKVVTVRSPSDGNFNWRQVVWHELAHTYHLYLSKSRVPRWFTEGLAEYEANVHDSSWIRHHDVEIAVKLQKDDIPSVMSFNRGFTHARHYGEILRSYQLASLSLHFIAQTWGFDAVVGMLRAWGEHRTTPQVLAEVLGVDVAQFDARFKAWLHKRFAHFHGQFLIDYEEYSDKAELERKLKLNANNPKAIAGLAAFYMLNRDFDNANLFIKRALSASPNDPLINQIALDLRQFEGRFKDVLAHGDVVLASFKDSYGLRIAMGRAAMSTEDFAAARVHFEAATQLFPAGVEAWSYLVRLSKSTKDDALYTYALKSLYGLEPHDPTLPKMLTREALQAKDNALMLSTTRRWLDTNPFDVEAQQAFIEANVKAKRWDDAVQGWDAMLILRPDLKAQTYTAAISTLAQAKQHKLAEQLAARAREDKLDAALIDKALKP